MRLTQGRADILSVFLNKNVAIAHSHIEEEVDGHIYEGIEEIWPDYPTKEDFLFNDEEY